MEWLEQNLDAYRIVGEILNDLRRSVQKGLREIHGGEWFRVGLPTDVFDRLVSTKEGETAIGWYEPEYQEIMDYAVFEDLHAILEHNRDHFPALVGIVPNPSLLNARFLELEALRRKIGRARPVSDAELTFLTRFLQRFRESLNEHNALGPIVVDSQPQAVEVEQEDQHSKSITDVSETPEAAEAVIPPSAPSRPVKETIPDRPRPPQRLQKVSDEGTGPDTEKRPAVEVQPASQEHQPATLSAALETKDSKTILRELFREVTAVAESLWSSDVIPQPVVWKAVRVSDWYEKNYAPLGMKPLSDFFSVIDEVERRMESGLAKHELQALLEENNFAQVLLALRDMFQRNKI